jgi:tetratricopeptide (TPR) repeat protein
VIAAKADLEVQRELRTPKEIAVALVTCAELSADLDDRAAARQYVAEALVQAADNPDAQSSKRDAQYVLARLADKENQQTDAIRLYTEILEGEETGRDPRWIVTAGDLAPRLLNAGRTEEALELAERAWEAAHRLQSPSLRLAAGCALAQCLLRRRTGESIQRALNVLLECCHSIETIRYEMTEETHKTSAAVAWVMPFELLLSTLLSVIANDQNPDWKQLAFQTAERTKARALAESIAASAAREAEAGGFRLTGVSVRPVDPREEITRVEFTTLRDMLRQEAGIAADQSARNA